GFVAVAVRARVVVIPILVCFEDQVVLRIAHPWIADQLGVDLLPEQRAGVTVAGDHDPGLRIDLADRLARFQSGLRPEVVTGVVRLVHQTIAPQSRVVVNFQSDLAPGLGKRGTRNLWRLDHLAVVTVVVVHIQDDFHAVLVRQVQRLLDARQFGGIQRGAKLGLDALPEEAETDQLEAQLTRTLVVALVGIGVALVVDTWNPARIEHAGREVHAYQIDTLAIARLRSRSRSRVRGRRRVLRLATGAAGNHGQGLRIADVAWRQLVAAEHDRQVLTDVIDRDDLANLTIGQAYRGTLLESCLVTRRVADGEAGLLAIDAVLPVFVGEAVHAGAIGALARSLWRRLGVRLRFRLRLWCRCRRARLAGAVQSADGARSTDLVAIEQTAFEVDAEVAAHYKDLADLAYLAVSKTYLHAWLEGLTGTI